ncbi:MAG: hypothetical protein V3V05_00830 [Pontiella sp.]
MKYIVVALIMAFSSAFANESLRFEYAPIFYHSRSLSNSISALAALENAPLEFEPGQGYLKSALKALHVSPESQVLVFKSTSFQKDRIAPKTPRAIYFNDTTFVGWIPGADYLEVISVDPFLGPIFYTLKQEPTLAPQFDRNNKDCLDCHSGAATQGVPGLFVRSIFSKGEGRYKTVNVYHQTPLSDRWGGWYVTGKHGRSTHKGNLPEDQDIQGDEHLNVVDLNPFFDTDPYLNPHSDLMALMVLEHQCHMLNLIIRANYRVRLLLNDHQIDPLDPTATLPKKLASEVTRHAAALTRYMLFTKEAALNGALSGTSKFAQDFSDQGIRDEQGRSLRDFDGTQRLFKYPCSYLIYSENFNMLPFVVKQAVMKRLHTVLTTNELDEDFPHLSAEDKKAIYKILEGTLPGLPGYWK